jgi:hypothetical protein
LHGGLAGGSELFRIVSLCSGTAVIPQRTVDIRKIHDFGGGLEPDAPLNVGFVSICFETLGGGKLSVRVVPLRDEVLGGSRQALLLLFACTGFVLLVACGNVANLLLARATACHKEVAIRAARGAARWRILRQFLAESACIALPAGAIGVGLAYASLVLLRPLIPADVPLAQEATVDRTALLFTLMVALLTTLITGIIPALWCRLQIRAMPLSSKDEASPPATAGNGWSPFSSLRKWP